jgi:tetratricopeptide (TPR) repeat protein
VSKHGGKLPPRTARLAVPHGIIASVVFATSRVCYCLNPLKAKQNATDRRFSTSRERWFHVLAIAVPLLGLVLLEFILRVAGYGYPTSFFLKTTVNGQTMFIENQQFSRRYFPPGLERTPQPVMFPAVKAPNTIRVFVLGESAAMGDPEPAYGFPRILEVLLREAVPGKKVEVINSAVTAINSHVIRDIAKDCADKQGDYWVVYMGNNEVVGPFGAGTVFGQQTPSLGFIRANIALNATRLGQLLDALRLKLTRGTGTPAIWEGMEMFLRQQVAQDDPRMAKVYAHFEANLRDILQLGEKSGAKVIVSTVASNLRDCAPFASLHRPGLTEAQRAEWDKFYQAGVAHESATNFSSALKSFEEAAKLDDRHAELRFRMARCEWALERFSQAKRSFELAGDLDTLRFRADEPINHAIRHVATPRAGLKIVDALEVTARSSPHGIAGEELFYEHVHFNFAGNYLMARMFVNQIVQGSANPAPLPGEAECARRLAFTDFDRYRVLDEVRQRLEQPPFSGQLGHNERDQRIREQLKRLDKSSFTNAISVYEQAIARAPGDWVLRENFATLLQDFAQTYEAEAQWQKVIQLLPHSEQGWFGLANLLDSDGRAAEAVTAFREALRRRPNSIEARNGLGLTLAGLDRFAEAISEYQRVLRLKPDFAEARVNLGQTLAQQGKFSEASAQYLEVLRRQSNNVPARINLGKLLAVQGRHAEAAAHYREALRLKPGNAVAHYNLGNALNALGRDDEATTHFAEAVRHNSSFPEARYNLALGLARQGRNAEVIEHLTEVVRLKPGFAEAHFNLGVALSKVRRYAEAGEQFRETLRLDPTHAAASQFMEQGQAQQQENR